MAENEDKTLSGEMNPIEEALKAIEEISPEMGGLEGIAATLALPEKEFNLMSELIISELEKSVNNPNDKLMMVAALNAGGLTTEDLIELYQTTISQIDNQLLETLSQNKRDFLKRILEVVINVISETEGIASRIITIPIELCRKGAIVPNYAHIGDAGLDIYAIEDYTIEPGETKIIPTGLKTAIPLGYELQVRPRSGQSAKTKLRIANSPGTIDANYRDEIGVIVENIEPKIVDIDYSMDLINRAPQITINSILHGKSYVIEKGKRFAQLVLSQKPTASFLVVQSVNEIGENRGGGFGHTGE